MLSRSRTLALLAALPAVAGSRPARAQAAKLRVGAATSDSYLEPYFADAQGIFAKNGLAVELTPFRSAFTTIERSFTILKMPPPRATRGAM